MSARTKAARQDEQRGRLETAPDAQEDRALTEAAAAVTRTFGNLPVDPRSLAAVAISAWIISRSRQSAGIRLTENLVFDLSDARLRGFAEAALPALGETLADLPPDLPLFELSKEQVVSVVVASVQAANAAAVAAGESALFQFDDPIPFGE
jgi:hypothetical protein